MTTDGSNATNGGKGKEVPPSGGLERRNFLKGLATVPIFGFFLYKLFRKKAFDDNRKKQILDELGIDGNAPAIRTASDGGKRGNLLRLGIIGFGGRGEYLIKSAGFAHPDWIQKAYEDSKKERMNKDLEIFMTQEDLNVEVAGVCDVFDVRAQRAIAASVNDVRPGSGTRKLNPAKRYRTYQELLQAKDIDAVLIATPDHWHAQMTIDAVNAGKHVYCEKCMTRTEDEVSRVVDAVKNSGMVFQLGHQNPQQEAFNKAKEIIGKNILGKVTLVEMTTNRNSPSGAWVYEIHKDGNPKTIDWDQFQEPAPHKVPFSRERFFRWRCWYDYGTGLAGDLLSHEFDAVNQILGMGIPKTATASGGIYYFKDGRDVPDLFQVVFEYPDRDLTLVYSATLANGRDRGRVFMGHDAAMEVGAALTVTADLDSTRFKDKIKNKIIDPELPLFTYVPGGKGIDAITSPTAKYFATKGLMYTNVNGRKVDLSHLHVREWIHCIRNGGKPSCGIERGFEEAISCHMATRSFLEGRRVEWDAVNKKIV